jgi:hypothetical protein
MTSAKLPAAVLAALLAGCGGSGPAHSPRDYASAVAVAKPDGSFTLIVGPATPIVKMESTLKFPQGDTEPGVHSVLMYDRPGTRPDTCLFQIVYEAAYSTEIVKENAVEQPCDGKRWARFRIAGDDVAFVAHLNRTSYKGTPVTLLEIGDHQAPDSIHLIY